VWQPPAKGPNSSNIWAPEIHFLDGNRGDGRWYLYYTAADAADPGDHTRNVFVLENASADPLQGTWTDKGRVNTHYRGLDGSVFDYKGQRYFLYSAYVGPQSNLFIAPMINPWTLSETQIEIARPTFDWEKHGDREILEGPEFLEGKNGKVFIIYSGSACWDDNYALGILMASSTSDLLKADSWTKSPEPVFTTSVENGVYGPGHNGFFKSPDDTEDWIVYHAKLVANGECKGRNVRIQKFTWNADGTPNFGKPVSTKTLLQKPSGE
jgi:GH43 family beta-xylosidase